MPSHHASIPSAFDEEEASRPSPSLYAPAPEPPQSSLSFDRAGPYPHSFSMRQLAPDTDFATWVAEMAHVQAERERVRLLNADVHALNLITMRKNEKNGACVPLIPLPHKIADWTHPYIAREEVHAVRLRLKLPQVWYADIQTIANRDVRRATACIVWWDFFSQRPITLRWPQLDRYIDAPFVRVDRADLIGGLYAAGYSPWQATDRAALKYYSKAQSPPKRAYSARKVPQI